MRQEWGIFNDEGLIESDFYSEQAAKDAMHDNPEYDDDPNIYVCLLCPDHAEYPIIACEACDDAEYSGEPDKAETESD